MTRYRLEWHRQDKSTENNVSIDVINWVIEITNNWVINWVITDLSYSVPQQEIIGKIVRNETWTILQLSQDTISQVFFCLLYELTRENNWKLYGSEDLSWDYSWEYIKAKKKEIDVILSQSKWNKLITKWNESERARITLTRI